MVCFWAQPKNLWAGLRKEETNGVDLLVFFARRQCKLLLLLRHTGALRRKFSLFPNLIFLALVDILHIYFWIWFN